jgi:hypothetical protein
MVTPSVKTTAAAMAVLTRRRAPVLSAKNILISFWIDLSQDEAALIFYYESQAPIGLVQSFGSD